MTGPADVPGSSPIQEIATETRSRSASISKGADDNESPIILDSGVPEHKRGGYGVEYRPAVEYSSFKAFYSTSWARFKSLWTKRFTFALLVGVNSLN